jgi:hypothetical protein
MVGDPRARAAGGVASALGFGRARKMKGGAIMFPMGMNMPKPILIAPRVMAAKGRKRKAVRKPAMTGTGKAGGKGTMTVL